VVRGRAEFNGQGFVDVGKGSLTIAGQTSEAAPSFDPNKREPVFDLTETSLDFELFVERAGSQIIASGAPARRGCGLPPEVVEEIVKRTDGVPLFLEEVTKVVPETALTNTAGGAIAVLPSSIGGAPDLAGLVDGATRPACRGTPAFGAIEPSRVASPSAYCMPHRRPCWRLGAGRVGWRIAVGMPIAGHPPHGSGRAQFEHPAPTLGV